MDMPDSSSATAPMELEDETKTTEDEDPLTATQLEEYQEWVDELGGFPDKVLINSLSMVAEDHMHSPENARKLYQIIRAPLVSPNVSGDVKLPLVYVVDSILKNVKGCYKDLLEEDAQTWWNVVYDSLSAPSRTKLKKVYNLWKDAAVLDKDVWTQLGKCFEQDGEGENSTLSKAGISFGKDGSILLMPQLRKAMQSLLDDLQSDVQDELEKVSLERLASIDPDLLLKIKRTAEDALRNNTASMPHASGTNAADSSSKTLSFLVETRSPQVMEQSAAWAKVSTTNEDINAMVHTLQHLILEASKADKRYTAQEAADMTGTLAVASATASLLTDALQELKDVDKKQHTSSASGSGSTGSFFRVDKKLFTSEGVKKKNDAVIGLLYGVGLPFVSSADGRRFATQLELSEHLDTLFRKGQLEKSMARTEERGWYVSDATWMGVQDNDGDVPLADVAMADADANEEESPESSRVPADEARDRCMICGITFQMVFDQDHGMYMYQNCRDMQVWNDEAAAEETTDVLVHVTCWRALGEPTTLTSDQALPDVLQSMVES